MKFICYVKRYAKLQDRKTIILLIPVYYSEATNRYHRCLPDFLLPYKHYVTPIILLALNHPVSLDEFSFPSDSSRFRWIKLFSFIPTETNNVHCLLLHIKTKLTTLVRHSLPSELLLA